MLTQLQIPDPCSEKWNEMHALQADCRYCAVCEKTIVDFTLKTDTEILQYLQGNAGKVCGKFRPDQLQRPLLGSVQSSEIQRRGGLTAIAASFAAMLAAQQPLEQQTLAAPDTSLSYYPNVADVLGRIIPQIVEEDTTRYLSGKITDESGEPLFGVSVSLVQSPYRTQSDSEGLFELKIPLAVIHKYPLELLLRYTGYPVKSVPVPEKVLTQDMALLPEMTRLELPDMELLGEVVVTRPHGKGQRIRTFFQRLFH